MMRFFCFLKNTFEVIEVVFDVLTAFDSFLSVMLIAVYLLSPYFTCALPCYLLLKFHRK